MWFFRYRTCILVLVRPSIVSVLLLTLLLRVLSSIFPFWDASPSHSFHLSTFMAFSTFSPGRVMGHRPFGIHSTMRARWSESRVGIIKDLTVALPSTFFGLLNKDYKIRVEGGILRSIIL